MAARNSWMEKFVIGSSSLAFTGMFAFAVAWGGLSGDVEDNTKAVQSIPRIQTDVAVIKESQKNTEEAIGDIKEFIKQLQKNQTHSQ